MRIRLSILSILLLLITGLAQAEVLSNLNVASVAVENSSVAERESALPKALAQVLIKVSGNPAVMTLPVIQNAADDVNAIIQSYSYGYQKASDGSSQLVLHVAFDGQAIKTLLTQAGQSIWPENRPLTLVWFQVHSANDVNIVSNTNNLSLATEITNIAKQRGIPIVLPTMDLQDQSYKRSENISDSLLQQVAARYGARVVMGGDIQETNNQWEGQWVLLINDAPFQWRDTADSISSLCGRAINKAVNLMANQFAVADEKALQSRVTLDVNNVVGLGDYAKLLSVLRHLSPVASVKVIDMKGSNLILEVESVGGADALSNALLSKKDFSILPAPDNSNDSAALFYRWKSDLLPEDSEHG